jgi:nitrogen fixation protein NifZ
MQTQWDLGDRVRVVRNVRNDGTYPGVETGELLVRRGSLGAVVDIGTFLQDQIIYSVHFLDDDLIVGCREEELIDGDEDWVPSRFEARERVVARKILALSADQRVPQGAVGEVLRVVRNGESVLYHLHFDCLPGRTLAVPETALASLAEARHD